MIHIDYKDSRPIYEQIIEKLQELMVLGVWDEDSQLPSVRSLALELSINPNTIQRAYAELERLGFIYSVKGKGSFVGSIKNIREIKKQEISHRMSELAQDARLLGMDRSEFIDCAAGMYHDTAKTADPLPVQASGKREGGDEYDTGNQPDETI